MTLIADIFPKIPAPKDMVKEMPKNRVSEDRSTDNMANGSKHFCNLNNSTFTIFINHSGGNYVREILF